jgi:hypothetical protein
LNRAVLEADYTPGAAAAAEPVAGGER